MRALAPPVLAGLLAGMLAGCTPPQPGPTPLVQRLQADPEALQSFLADSTLKGFTPGFGTQLGYLSAQGGATLILPGSVVLATGTWRVQPGAQGSEVCFAYEPQEANPITQQAEGAEICAGVAPYLASLDSLVDGDPLGLAGTTTLPGPFAPEEDVSLAQAQTRLGATGVIGPNKLSQPQ
ncbi:MAG: hypothetical protein AAFR93_05275 [Pseudomonadota bacterium]